MVRAHPDVTKKQQQSYYDPPDPAFLSVFASQQFNRLPTQTHSLLLTPPSRKDRHEETSAGTASLLKSFSDAHNEQWLTTHFFCSHAGLLHTNTHSHPLNRLSQHIQMLTSSSSRQTSCIDTSQNPLPLLLHTTQHKNGPT